MVAQVAVSVLLLVGAGLFIRSLRNLRLLDLGVKTENLIAFNVTPGLSGYTPIRTKQFDKQLVERIRSLPGVTGTAFANMGIPRGERVGQLDHRRGLHAEAGRDPGSALQRRQP